MRVKPQFVMVLLLIATANLQSGRLAGSDKQDWALVCRQNDYLLFYRGADRPTGRVPFGLGSAGFSYVESGLARVFVYDWSLINNTQTHQEYSFRGILLRKAVHPWYTKMRTIGSVYVGTSNARCEQDPSRWTFWTAIGVVGSNPLIMEERCSSTDWYIYAPSVNPTATLVAYLSYEKVTIWDRIRNRKVPGPEASYVRWSPRGDLLAVRDRDGKLVVIPVNAEGDMGIPRKTDISAFEVAWAPSGEWLFANTYSGTDSERVLFRVVIDKIGTQEAVSEIVPWPFDFSTQLDSCGVLRLTNEDQELLRREGALQKEKAKK